MAGILVHCLEFFKNKKREREGNYLKYVYTYCSLTGTRLRSSKEKNNTLVVAENLLQVVNILLEAARLCILIKIYKKIYMLNRQRVAFSTVNNMFFQTSDTSDVVLLLSFQKGTMFV